MQGNNPESTEKTYIFDKKLDCPVCGKSFTAKVVKTGKARFVGTDMDLRPRYTGIDTIKYDVYMCPKCGYAAVSREFPHMTLLQKKNIKDEISSKFEGVTENGDYYTYDDAILRYKMALLTSIKKPTKLSECAYLCLKLAWLYRSVGESVCPDGDVSALAGDAKRVAESAKTEEQKYLKEAYEGFDKALTTEFPPVCGMDEVTLNYLMSVLAYENGNNDMANKYGYSVLSSRNASSKIKDKERDLLDLIKSDKI